VDWIHLAEYRNVGVGGYENGNETFGSIRDDEFLYQLGVLLAP
jgi:hypothetical protein